MTLNNEIAVQQFKYDEIEDKKNKIKQQEEENQMKKLSKTSELGMILIAIENLYLKCDEREGAGALKYIAQAEDDEAKNYDKVSKRARYAEQQLEKVMQYMKDFDSIIADWDN